MDRERYPPALLRRWKEEGDQLLMKREITTVLAMILPTCPVIHQEAKLDSEVGINPEFQHKEDKDTVLSILDPVRLTVGQKGEEEQPLITRIRDLRLDDLPNSEENLIAPIPIAALDFGMDLEKKAVLGFPPLDANPNKDIPAKEARPSCPDPTPPAKVKKPKGMQFDTVYKEFNTSFVVECSALIECCLDWTKFLEGAQDSIPGEIVGEIESAMGQAKLLLDSKLPQFAELLYFYLSRTLNPHPILACDLEGWWAVAMISIDKVKDRFDKLETLKNNGWIGEKKKRRRR